MKCPRCTRDLPKHTKVCYFCNLDLTNQPNQPNQPQQSSGNGLLIGLIAGCGVLVTMLLAAIVLVSVQLVNPSSAASVDAPAATQGSTLMNVLFPTFTPEPTAVSAAAPDQATPAPAHSSVSSVSPSAPTATSNQSNPTPTPAALTVPTSAPTEAAAASPTPTAAAPDATPGNDDDPATPVPDPEEAEPSDPEETEPSVPEETEPSPSWTVRTRANFISPDVIQDGGGDEYRLISSVRTDEDGNTETTSYSYSDDGLLTGIDGTDSAQYEYSEDGYVTFVRKDGCSYTFIYDGSRIVSCDVTDDYGSYTLIFEYSGDELMSAEGSSGDLTVRWNWLYDSDGRMTAQTQIVTDASGEIGHTERTYTYENAGLTGGDIRLAEERDYISYTIDQWYEYTELCDAGGYPLITLRWNGDVTYSVQSGDFTDLITEVYETDDLGGTAHTVYELESLSDADDINASTEMW